MEEIEVKFLNVEPDALESKLRTLGATREAEYHYRRYVFDYPDLRLNEAGAWLRLRDEGERITLSFKQRLGIVAHDGTTNDLSMEEIEVTVSDFDLTRTMLLHLGFMEKFYIENRRIRWRLGPVEFDLEFWPALPPYLEIEAPTWADIDHATALLGLKPGDRNIFSTTQIYALHGINDLDYARITFEGLVPKPAN